MAGRRERRARWCPNGGFLAGVAHPQREAAVAKGKLEDAIARIGRMSRHVEAAHDRDADTARLSALRVRARHRRGRDRQVGVYASEPTIPATCTRARLVRRATQGTGAYGPNEFRRAVGRSHLSPIHLHKYFCQIVDNIDCHNKQEE